MSNRNNCWPLATDCDRTPPPYSLPMHDKNVFTKKNHSTIVKSSAQISAQCESHFFVFSCSLCKGWPHHERSFFHFCLSSTFITSSVNDNLVHDVMLSNHVVLGLPRVRKPGVEPYIISFSGRPLSSSMYVHSMPVFFV